MGNLERSLTNNSLAIPALSLAFGIYCSNATEFGIFSGLTAVAVAALIYLIILFKSSDPIKSYEIRQIHYVWMGLAFWGVGVVFAELHRPDPAINLEKSEDCLVFGEVTRVKEATTGDILTVDVSEIKKKGYSENFRNLPVLVRLSNSDCVCAVGDLVRFKGKFDRIQDNPNSFQTGYSDMMAAAGIRYSCSVSGPDIETIGKTISLESISRKIRDRIEQTIENSKLNKNTQNFLITVLLGDKSYLDPDLRQRFADAGVAHVLALSGMHIGIIGGFFLIILFPLNFAGRYKTRLIIAASLLWVYAFISGMAPSTVRACIMASFAAIAIVLERKRYVFNSLYGACLVILLFSPMSLYDAGFQLSVVCVVCLAAFANHINFANHRSNPKLYRFMSLISATVAATFGSWIVTAFHFHSFPMAFLPANILILPLLPYYLLLAIVSLSLSAVGMENGLLDGLVDKVFDYSSLLLQWLGNGNALEVNVGFGMVVLWIVGVALLSSYLNIVKWKPLLYASVAILVFTVSLIPARASSVGDGSFIISNEYNRIGLIVKTSGEEKRHDFKRGCISEATVRGISILCMDADVSKINSSGNYDYAIIAGGYKGNIEDLIGKINISRIVLHPSIRKKREKSLMMEAERFGIDCHSLRYDSSLKHCR